MKSHHPALSIVFILFSILLLWLLFMFIYGHRPAFSPTINTRVVNPITPSLIIQPITNTITPSMVMTPTKTNCVSLPAYHPVGNLLVERTDNDQGVLPFAYIFNLQNSSWTQITDLTYPPEFPSISRDRRRMIFADNDMNQFKLVIQGLQNDSDNSIIADNNPKIIYQSMGQILSKPLWSSDDQWITFSVSGDPHSSAIYVLNSVTGQILSVKSPSQYNQMPTWIPDTKSLLFLGGDDGDVATIIYMISLDEIRGNATASVLIDNYHMDYYDGININQLGQGLITYYPQKDISSILLFNISSKEVIQLFTNAASNIKNGLWSPDGKIFTYREISKKGTIYLSKIMASTPKAETQRLIESWETHYPELFSYIWSPSSHTIAYTNSELAEDVVNYNNWIYIIDLSKIIDGSDNCNLEKKEIGPFTMHELILREWIN